MQMFKTSVFYVTTLVAIILFLSFITIKLKVLRLGFISVQVVTKYLRRRSTP